ncbi:hypothetical protein ACFL3N_03075 [Candidatus Omnitrophota bacterium]
MEKEFLGYHSEWNLGSPGGWDYQRMAQEIGRFSWNRIRAAVSGLDIDIDFDHPMLNPVPPFARMLLRAHKNMFGKERPSIALIAEEETLEKVGENIHFVEYLNSIEGVSAYLTSADKLELKGDAVCYQGNRLTTIFMDFNNRVIVKLKKKHDMKPLIRAIKKGLVVNPRGMEPVGAKGVFEALTSELKNSISNTTLKRTPWTRQLYKRSTIGPKGETIPDLLTWVKDNWERTILKPVHGYSGQGIIIGHKESDIEGSLRRALDAGDYIVQPLVPMGLWAEEFPWFDKKDKTLSIKRWQTDFRCFVTDAGPIGFVTRFGGIPTNVGMGGGVQSTAVLRSKIPIPDAIKKINDVIIKLGAGFISQLQEEIDKRSVEIGNVYLLGPLMSTLRPRIITPEHVSQIREYGKNLWDDAVMLEKLWLEGKLTKYVQINKEEEEIARLCPWRGTPALMAADGLFGFGGDLT